MKLSLISGLVLTSILTSLSWQTSYSDSDDRPNHVMITDVDPDGVTYSQDDIPEEDDRADEEDSMDMVPS